MPRVKVTGNGEIEEVVRGKVYKIRHHLGKDPETGKYRRHLKRIVEMFGGALVNDIDASDISRAYAARRDSGEMSASTVHNVHVIFSQLMESAKRDRLIATN